MITDDYPGEAPHRFTGGTIKQVAIDVSGEAYVDLEREADLMLMRSSELSSGAGRVTLAPWARCSSAWRSSARCAAWLL